MERRGATAEIAVHPGIRACVHPKDGAHEETLVPGARGLNPERQGGGTNGAGPGSHELVSPPIGLSRDTLSREISSPTIVASVLARPSPHAPCAGTYQGAYDESTWSRGQAWAVYGYLMLYRYTGEDRFLEYFYAVLG